MSFFLHFNTFLLIFVYGISKVLIQLVLILSIHISFLLQILDYLPLPINLLYQPFLFFLLVRNQLFIFQSNKLNILDKLGLRFQFYFQTLLKLVYFNAIIFQFNTYSLSCLLLNFDTLTFLLLLINCNFTIFNMVKLLSVLIFYILRYLLNMRKLTLVDFVLLGNNSFFVYFLSHELYFQRTYFVLLDNFLLDRYRFIWVESTCCVP